MFGLFKDNKPQIAKAIGFAMAAEAENFEVVKQTIIKIAQENRNSMFVIAPDGKMMFVDNDMHMLPQKNSVRVQGSSREMFQALNQISKNANYNADSDYASGDIENFNITMMKIKGSNQINIMAYIKNRDTLLYQLIKENGGHTL